MKKNNKSEKKSTPDKPAAAPKPVAKPVAPVESNGLVKMLEGKELYALLGAVVLSILFVFWDFLTFEKTYFFKDIGSDSLNMYYPNLMHMSDYVKAYGGLTWTFSQGLGQNMFPLWLSDFFTNIIIVIFSKESLPYTIAYVEVVKILLCCFVFYKYLNELKLNKFTVCVMSYLFAFSGYIILGGCWTVFSVEALYVALILYGYERWLNHGKILWLVTGIALLSFLQPFLLFPYAIFLAAYMPVRYNDVRGNEWGKFPLFIIKTGALAVIGVAISSYQLFPDVLQYIESPRVGGEARLIEKLKEQPMFGMADEWLRFTTTFRTFGSDMLGTGSAFQGWQNYLEAPLFYCGIFCLVAFPQMFVGLTKKQRIAYGIFAGLFFLPILFPYFRYTFWAFAGDYFRTYSFVVILLLLLFTAKALDNIINTGKVNLIVLGVTVLFLLFLLYTPNEQFAPAINVGLKSFATLLIFVYAGILFGLGRTGDMKRYAAIGLAAMVFIEIGYFSSQTVNDRDVVTGEDLKEKIGFNDYTTDAVKFIKERDKGFYRLNKDYSSGVAIHQSINDAKAQGYFGSASYHSFNQINYIKFLAEMNVLDPKDENQTRWAMGVNTRPLLFSLVGGKYWLVRKPETQAQNFGYDSIGKVGNVKIMQNRFAVPLAFAYDTVLDAAAFKTLGVFAKDQYLLRGCVVANEDADLLGHGKRFNLADTVVPFSFDQYGAYVSKLRGRAFTVTEFKESNIKGNISLNEPGVLFFSIPFDDGWKATVNGKEAKLYKVNIGFLGLKLPGGKSDVEIKFEPRMMKTGGMVSLAALVVFVGLVVLGMRRKTV
ncbi:MAG: hypothetical protein K0Q79_3341 [Flavipsychrobacter sp.]|jgi:uncharacterized membrane protein YfhO|nr:hypothetical protein [Flavipsychrobacter sp.]